MVAPAILQQFQVQSFFEHWNNFVSPERIDDLLALSPEPAEEAARLAVDECVRRFNTLNDAWIGTIEREDIYEQIGIIVTACGFDYQEDWLDERDW
jgi:hypothetical protein